MSENQTKNDSQGSIKWNWSTDPYGRVTSVSSQFSATLGALAAKNIIGNSFWGFCDNLSKPNANWKDLSNAFQEKSV